MKSLVWVLSSLVAGASTLAPAAPHPASPPTAGPRRLAPERVPVVVELFTSEGCSSCPAADAVLRELQASQPVPGVEIIALGEHVDYWNRLGWRDPFSAAQFSERQRAYAAHFAAGSYTPQAVVDGRYELVGSRRQELLRHIAEAARAPQANVQLAAVPGALAVRVSQLPAGIKAARVLLALTETDLSTQVGQGENAGRLLQHAAVVRRLRPLGTVAAASTLATTVPLGLEAGWNPTHLRAVVLVQDPTSQRIIGAASLPLAPKAGS